MEDNKKSVPLRVFLVEDHHIMRRGLGSLLTAGRDIIIVGEAGDGEHALELLSKMDPPDLIIMDVSLPGINGIDTVHEVKKLEPSIKILMLSMYDNPIYIFQAMEAGAAGYILKQSIVEELNLAIDTVMEGNQYLSPQISEVLDPELKPGNLFYKKLTARELEVLERLAEGANVKDIAEAMTISIYTVYTHMNNIKQKMGIERTTDLVRYAAQNPLVLGK